MRAIVAVVFVFTLGAGIGHTQEKTLLKTKGWGSLAGKVVFQDNMKPAADVVVFLKVPKDIYFPIHDEDKIRKDTVAVDQPGNDIVPHLSAHYPHYFDGKKEVLTGQKFMLQNTSNLARGYRGIGHPVFNPGFLLIMPANQKTAEVKLKPQPLPLRLDSPINPKASAYVCVFDHPYFAITENDGSYKVPRVPAGALK